jgi:hypothetical protein
MNTPLPSNLPADPWSPLAASRGGMPVAICWTPRLWLHAVVLSADDRGCELLLGDGSTTVVPRESAVSIPTGSPFQVGHEVLARWRNSAMFPGTISAVSPEGYTIAWFDGDVPLVVPAGSLTFLEWCRNAAPVMDQPANSGAEIELPPPPIAKPTLAVRSPVAIRHEGRFLIARIEANTPGRLAVRLMDGTRGTVPAGDLVPIPERHAFAEGDQVLALWRHGHMYPGTITEVTPSGYLVAWHDGDTPIVVQKGNLTFLAWVLR